MERLIIKSPAKINLGLNIISKRNDGYHNLETIFYPLHDLFDTLTFEKADEFSFVSNTNLPENSSGNLIINAIEKIKDLIGKKTNVKIKLEKNIPIGAGLGGGSSNAAKTLIAVNELFDLKIHPYIIRKIALELGSDVPYFLNPVPAFAESRGEMLIPLKLNINFPILIVNPNIHISTKEAFNNIEPRENHIKYLTISAFNKKEFLKLSSYLHNDFEEYVFKKYPFIKEIKRKLNNFGAFFTLLSGTGSTIYGMFENIEDALTAKKYYESEYFVFIQPND